MAHTHEGDRNYYIDQLCTVGVCAALGGVCVALYLRSSLGLLADPFRFAVLIGGVALILVALARGITLFVSAGKPVTAHNHHHEHDHGHHHHEHEHHHHHGEEACEHGHEHPHAHGHEHHHHHHEHAHAHGPEHVHHHHDHGPDHGHDHDHGHSHGWNPIRYVFLLVPIVLFLVRMPSPAFNARFSDFLARFEAGKLGQVNLDIQVVGRNINALGLQIDQASPDEPLKVVRVLPGSAAEKAGVKSEDVITSIILDSDEEGKPLKEAQVLKEKEELTLDRAAQKLRGKPKTTVKLTLERAGEPKPLLVALTREVVIQSLGFKELERAGVNAFSRKAYEGMTVRLKGQIVAKGEVKAFSMMRVKITCCGADATTLKVVITLDPQTVETIRVPGDFEYMQWVEVTGDVSFHKMPDRNEYVPVVQIASKAEGIRPCEPEPFLQ